MDASLKDGNAVSRRLYNFVTINLIYSAHIDKYMYNQFYLPIEHLHVTFVR